MYCINVSFLSSALAYCTYGCVYLLQAFELFISLTNETNKGLKKKKTTTSLFTWPDLLTVPFCGIRKAKNRTEANRRTGVPK